MKEALPLVAQIVTMLFLGMAAIGFLRSSRSSGGYELPLISHPLMVRLRFFAFGLFTALWKQGYDWENPGALGVVTATLLLVGCIRVRKASTAQNAEPEDVTPVSQQA